MNDQTVKQVTEEAFDNLNAKIAELVALCERKLAEKDKEIAQLKEINEALSDPAVLKPFMADAEKSGQTFDEWITDKLEFIKSLDNKAILVAPAVKNRFKRIALLRSIPLQRLTQSKKTTDGLNRTLDNEWI